MIVSAAAKLIAHEIVPRVQISFSFSFCCNLFCSAFKRCYSPVFLLSYFQEFLGPEVVSHFVMHGKTVAETIKHMLMILKKNMKNAELSSLYLESIKRVSDLYGGTCTK